MEIIKNTNSILKAQNKIVKFHKSLFINKRSHPSLTTPSALAVDNLHNQLHVADYGTNNILVFDLSNPFSGPVTVLAPDQTGASNPNEINYDAASNRMMVSNAGEFSFSWYDPGNPVVGGFTKITGAQAGFTGNPVGIGIDPLGGRLWVPQTNSRLDILDYNDPTIHIETILPEFSGISYPGSCKVDRVGGRVFFSNAGDNTVPILDYTNPGTVSPVILENPDFNILWDIDIKEGEYIVIASSNPALLAVFDYHDPLTRSPRIVTYVEGGFDDYFGIALDPVNNKIYTAAWYAKTLSAMWDNINPITT